MEKDKSQFTYHRQSLRLVGHDYTEGAYFVTICAFQRELLFGDVEDDEVFLNTLGCIVEDEWLSTAEIRPNVRLDSYVTMPNHFHAILTLDRQCRGDLLGRPSTINHVETPRLKGPQRGSLGALMAQFKRITTIKINRVRELPHDHVWQRNYFERIIRHEKMLNAFRQYIDLNPLRWAKDHEFVAK